MPVVTVYLPDVGPSRIDGLMKSFQVQSAVSTRAVVTAGFISGKITCQNVRRVVLPSMVAASSRLVGIDRMYALNRKIANGNALARSTSTSPVSDPYSPRLRST